MATTNVEARGGRRVTPQTGSEGGAARGVQGDGLETAAPRSGSEVGARSAAAVAGPESRATLPSSGIGSGRGAALAGPQWSDGERSEAERNEGPASADRGGAATSGTPDPEVSAKPKRRRFNAEYKRRILRQADACSRGELAALLRREGLYSSHLGEWRRQREHAEAQALSPKKRGPKPVADPALVAENQQLRRENQRLQRRLRKAEVCLEIQKKASELLGIPLNSPEPDEND